MRMAVKKRLPLIDPTRNETDAGVAEQFRRDSRRVGIGCLAALAVLTLAALIWLSVYLRPHFR